MLKILFMGDRHNSETVPKSRIDDYYESCKAKDEEIISIAKANDVKLILHAGDFWTDADRKLGNEFVGKIARRWLGAGVPIVGIAGNHDLLGNNEGSLPSTTAGLLSSLGIFKTLLTGEVMMLEDGDTSIAVTGVNYHKGMDKKEFLSDYVLPEKRGDLHIHIAHGMLSPKSLGKIIRHTTIDEIKNTAADVTLCGHDHIGFGIVDYNNKLFINPGAVVRMTCDKREMSRTVSVVLLTINEGKISAEMIPLKSAKPASEVLDRSEVEAENEKQRYKDFVRSGVEKLNLGSTVSVSEVLEEIYAEESVPQEIRDSIEKKILEKRGSVKEKALKPPEGTEIEKIVIHNFQSHADTAIALDTGFNVIVGESHQGKSAILRAIRWVAEGKPAGKGIIRIGEKDAFVELTLKNGTIIRRFISARENGYKVYLPSGETMEGNTKMVPQIQALLGWNSMPIGENEEIPLNHLRQGDSWYLIGDKYTSSDRARILGAINKTEGADAAIKDFDKENSRIADTIKREEIEIVNLVEEINTAEKKKADLVAIKAILNKVLIAEKIRNYLATVKDYEEKTEALRRIDKVFKPDEIMLHMTRVSRGLEKQDRITGYVAIIHKEKARMGAIDTSLKRLEEIGETEKKCESVKSLLEKHGKISELLDSHSKQKAILIEQDNIVRDLCLASSLETDSIARKIECLNRATELFAISAKAKKAVDFADRVIDKTNDLDDCNSIKETILDSLKRAQAIQQALSVYEKLAMKTVQDEEAKCRAEAGYSDAVNAKIAILKETHLCPICHSDITDDIIAKIKEDL